MTETQVSALLGRPLTSVEHTNFKLYLKIAREQLEDMLCISLCDSDDPKVYETEEGYSTVFTDIFQEIDEVKVNGEVIEPEKYSPRQWDKRNGRWYNSLIFSTKWCENTEIEVYATWGFASIPADLQSLLAGLVGLATSKTSASLVQSKQVEDFRIAMRTDVTALDQLLSDNQSTVAKYSMCNTQRSKSGEVCNYDSYGF